MLLKKYKSLDYPGIRPDQLNSRIGKRYRSQK